MKIMERAFDREFENPQKYALPKPAKHKCKCEICDKEFIGTGADEQLAAADAFHQRQLCRESHGASAYEMRGAAREIESRLARTGEGAHAAR